jgi:hypothetical protein
MKKSELISEGRMTKEEKAVRAVTKRGPKRHLITCLFSLVFVLFLAGVVYPESDDALFIDEEGNLKLQKGESVNEFSNDVTLVGNSDRAVPTEHAVKTYVDTKDEAVRTYIDTKHKEVRTHIESQLQQYSKVVENVGNHLRFLECGGRYRCTPRDCLNKCIELGMRMATYSEVYAWAVGGKDHCAYMWMLHPEKKFVRAYPMYSNRTAPGCGDLNTGNIPRMLGNETHGWNSKAKANCACSSLK